MMNNSVKLADFSLEKLNSYIISQMKATERKEEVYLAAGGYFQDTYVGLFEGISTNFGDSTTQTEASESYLPFIADLFFRELSKKYPDLKFPFNKILCVTVPSQLIGKALLDKFQKSHNTVFYQRSKNDVVSYSRVPPSIVRLSNYYTFAEEIQFRSIVDDDRILIVNDVISTGSLIFNIVNSLSGRNKDENIHAAVTNILTVVDTRIHDRLINRARHVPSFYFNEHSAISENDVISLSKIPIKKYRENPYPERLVVRINPILNSRIAVDKTFRALDRTVIKNSEKFFSSIPSESLRIGHLTQNSLHHSYFITPSDLFEPSEDGISPGGSMLLNIAKTIAKLERDEDTIKKNTFLKQQLAEFSSYVVNQTNDYQEFYAKIKTDILSFFGETTSETKTSKSNQVDDFSLLNEDDFVFFPTFSGIEKISRGELQNIFGVSHGNIISLQRFDTNRGWRFLKPHSGFFNKLKNKTAVIIDMGSFSGDSVIQMIETLCVFELKKVIVISIIGRLNDFTREFLGRVREMKFNVSANETEIGNNQNGVTPVNIYFGVHLHIPSHQSTKICEHCKELSSLQKSYQSPDFHSSAARAYLERKIKQLEPVPIADSVRQCPEYFPQLWNGDYDINQFFETRDRLGKLDGYHFFNDYYDYFDKVSKEPILGSRALESLICIILHEKHLYDVVSNQLPDIKKRIVRYVKDIIGRRISLLKLYYRWPVYSLVEAYFVVNEKKDIFKLRAFKNLLLFIEQNSFGAGREQCLSIIAYKMWEAFLPNKHSDIFYQSELVKSIKSIWHEIEDNEHIYYKSLIVEFNRILVNSEIGRSSDMSEAFIDLFSMYDEASAYKPSHVQLAAYINDIKTSINSLLISQEEERFEELYFRVKSQYTEARLKLMHLVELINKVREYFTSLTKLFRRNSFAKDYFSGHKSLIKLIELIDIRLGDSFHNKHDLVEIYETLVKIEENYFEVSYGDNFYSLWRDSNYVSLKEVWDCFKMDWEKLPNYFKSHIGDQNYQTQLTSRLNGFEILSDPSYHEEGVRLHSYLLVTICKELIDNSIKHASGSKVLVTLSTLGQNHDLHRMAKFTYQQNRGTKGQPTNGLANVQKIISDFSGTFQFVTEKNKLIIEVTIPITWYRNNG